MSKTILFKNNKGGVGKSLLTFWTGHLLSTLPKEKGTNKVLIITSDSQNNILQMAGKTHINGLGLQDYIEGKEQDHIKLRENLYYIPLTEVRIKKTFESKFQKLITKFKEEYDYILIDGSPVLNLDTIFINASDKVIIPSYLDSVTTKGMINLIQSIGLGKVALIVPNRVGRTKLEREHLEKLKTTLAGVKVSISQPIYQSSKVLTLIEKSKTIVETKNKKYDPIRRVFVEIIKELI